MRRKLVIIGVLIAVLVLSIGVTNSVLAAGTEDAAPGSWQAMINACRSGDWNAMGEAARGLFGDNLQNLPCHSGAINSGVQQSSVGYPDCCGGISSGAVASGITY